MNLCCIVRICMCKNYVFGSATVCGSATVFGSVTVYDAAKKTTALALCAASGVSVPWCFATVFGLATSLGSATFGATSAFCALPYVL